MGNADDHAPEVTSIRLSFPKSASTTMQIEATSTESIPSSSPSSSSSSSSSTSSITPTPCCEVSNDYSADDGPEDVITFPLPAGEHATATAVAAVVTTKVNENDSNSLILTSNNKNKRKRDGIIVGGDEDSTGKKFRTISVQQI